MPNLSFVIVEPGRKDTPASIRETRVGIHSHAQRVTQARKRERKLKEQETTREQKQKVPTTSVTKRQFSNLNEVFGKFDGRYNANILASLVGVRKYRHGLPTPSPEPEIDRPLTNYSSWTDDQRYGICMFQHVTILDINDITTNMTFWKSIVPAYSRMYTCVRNIASAVACANNAIQHRDDTLFLTALDLHLRAIVGLRQDLTTLPLSAQVACCLLFDAFNILRCDFVQAGQQIAAAKRLTHTVSVGAYLEDEKLADVCDALDRMSQASAWSLWNPSNFLRYEGLRYAEPNLYIELTPIDFSDGQLKGLAMSMERLSRHFSGRLRRNLSETACISTSTRLAKHVLEEFATWKIYFERYKASSSRLNTSEERATIQQAEIAWNFTYVTFTAGVLNYGELIYDDPKYQHMYNRINVVAEQRFNESASYSSHVQIKPFLQIIIPTLWLMTLMSRDPHIRARSIKILKSQHYQEGEFHSITAGLVAEKIVEIETRGQAVELAYQVSEADRIRVEGIKYLAETKEVLIKYTRRAESVTFSSSPSQVLMPFTLGGETNKISAAVNALSQSCTLYRKVRPSAAPSGFIKPMYYLDEFVEVYTVLPNPPIPTTGNG